MWKFIKINNDSFTFKCNFDKTKNEIKFVLTNFKQMWCEYCTLEDVLQLAKNLNRRIEYDNDTIIKTIIHDTPNKFHFDNEQEILENENNVFHLTYLVSGNLPFKFFWKLKKCSKDEFSNTIIYPLLASVNILYKQNEELKIIIENKDREIDQYKQEGAILRRSKFATETFSKKKFETKYSLECLSNTIQLVSNINNENILKIFRENESIIAKNDDLVKNFSSSITASTSGNNNEQTISPRKKRQCSKLQVRLMKYKKMKNVDTNKIDYCSDSDSCTPPNNLESVNNQTIQTIDSNRINKNDTSPTTTTLILENNNTNEGISEQDRNMNDQIKNNKKQLKMPKRKFKL